MLCPQCGTMMIEGRCPGCAAVQSAPPGKSRAVAILSTVVVSINLCLGLAFWWVVRHVPRQSFSRPGNMQSSKPRRIPHHLGPLASLTDLKGSGVIWLVQVGDHHAPYSMNDFAAWLHEKYRLDVRVLPAEKIDPSAWDPGRRQYIADDLIEQMQRDHPDLAADPQAYLIGFTDADLYSVWSRWSGTFTQRGVRGAIVSSDGLQDWAGTPARSRAAANAHLQASLRRILLKDVAMLYWHLPPNHDPTSLLQQPLNVNVATEDIWQSDLDPARTAYGQYEGEPCIFFRYTAKTGLQPLPGGLVHSCTDIPSPLTDSSTEVFELDLRTGSLIARHTDADLPGVIPIRFERALRDGWPKANSFGVTGIDNYDSFLASNDNIQISIVSDDGNNFNLIRRPRWLPFLSLVRYVDEDFSGRFYDMRWQTAPFPHYDLRRFDGQIDTYLPCGDSSVLRCYLDGIRDPQGHELKFDRDRRRQLVQLTSPDSHWVRITHGAQDRIDQVQDSTGRIVRYGYDDRDQLISVTYPSGESLHFTWDDGQHLLTFSAALPAESTPRLLLTNEYTDGRITRLTLADGRAYTCRYDKVQGNFVRAATVRDPQSNVYRLALSSSGSTIWEQPAAPTTVRP